MTNKEVIYFLDEVRKIILDDKSWLESTTQPINEAFDMAIKALEQSELCNDDKGCSNCMYGGRPTYKSPCSECRDNSQWEMKPISRSHENGTECEDTIIRQAAIDTLDKHLRMTDVPVSYPGIISALTEWLNELPSAQPEPQWIPVTERLPEEYGNYLISIHGEDEPDIGTINPKNKRGWSLCDASGFYWASDKSLIVTAWMPFPEPYRAERRTDEDD